MHEAKLTWIATARLQFRPSPRSPCFVCGKHRALTHAHHVIPLSFQFDRGVASADHEHVWLCPNHHVVLHLMLGLGDDADAYELGRRSAAAIAELETDEIRLLLELLNRSSRR